MTSIISLFTYQLVLILFLNRYLERVKGDDKIILRATRHLMDKPVILDNRKKGDQKLELIIKLIEHWCKLAEENSPKSIKCLGIIIIVI